MSGNLLHDLKDFYADARGRRVARMIRHALYSYAPSTRGMRVIGVGYTTPYLDLFSQNTTCIALMPAQQGADYWPEDAHNRTALIDETALPLETNSVDFMVAVHYLEQLQNPREALDEIWRVLKSNGRLILVVPNRLGLWARAEWSPFGHGTPYSLVQLRQVLRESQFVFERTQPLLFTPPLRGGVWDRTAHVFDYIGAKLCPALAGAHLIEVSKQLYASIGGGTPARVTTGFIPKTAPKALPTPFDRGEGVKS
jgi:SAM-dependent methyltransferase